MNGYQQIVAIFAVSLTLFGLIFPLRNVEFKEAIHGIAIHGLFSIVVLLEVSLLGRFNGSWMDRGELIAGWNPWASGVLCVVVLDLVSYLWHRLNHVSSHLWRWHKFHHKTEVMDPFVAYFFHPIEVFLGFQLRALVVFMLGFGVNDVSVFLLFFGISNLFQHSNLRIPLYFERLLMSLFVTPRVHHTHHLKDVRFRDRNFSTIFVFWDKIFKTYQEPCHPETGELGV